MSRFLGSSLLLLQLFFSAGAHAQEGLVTGLIWNDEAYNQIPLKINYDVAVPGLPAVYSLKQFCPPVINQGTSNTAVAWATAWYARTMVESIACNKKDVVFQDAYNGFFNHRLVTDDCSKPVTLTDMLRSLQQQGARKFREFKDVCPDSISEQTMKAALPHRLSGSVRLFQTFDKESTKVNAIRTALHGNSPVVIATIRTPSLDLAKEVWQITEQRSRGKGGHAFCVVGYDDTKFGGAFEVVNSFGKSWGKNGFAWIKYEDVAEAVLYGFELFDTQYAICDGEQIEAQVQFVKTDGVAITGEATGFGFYSLTGTQRSGTEFNIRISTGHRMFVYGILADASFATYTFLPQDNFQFATAFTQSKQSVILPFGTLPFSLQPPAGANHFIFVFSAMPLDPAVLSKKISEGVGDLPSRVQELAKGTKILKTISWSNDLKFSAAFEKDFLVTMTVKMEQVD